MAAFTTWKDYDTHLATLSLLPRPKEYVQQVAQQFESDEINIALEPIWRVAVLGWRHPQSFCVNQSAYLELGIVENDSRRAFYRVGRHLKDQLHAVEQIDYVTVAPSQITVFTPAEEENGEETIEPNVGLNLILTEIGPDAASSALVPAGRTVDQVFMVRPRTFAQSLMRSKIHPEYSKAYAFALEALHAYDRLVHQTERTRFESVAANLCSELAATRNRLNETNDKMDALHGSLCVVAGDAVNQLDLADKSEVFVLLAHQTDPLKCRFVCGQKYYVTATIKKWRPQGYREVHRMCSPNKIVAKARLFEVVPAGIVRSHSYQDIRLCVGKTAADLIPFVNTVIAERTDEAAAMR